MNRCWPQIRRARYRDPRRAAPRTRCRQTGRSWRVREVGSARSSEDTEARAALALSLAPLLASARCAGGNDDLLALLELAAGDLGDAPVGDTGGNAARLGFAALEYVHGALVGLRGIGVAAAIPPIAARSGSAGCGAFTRAGLPLSARATWSLARGALLTRALARALARAIRSEAQRGVRHREHVLAAIGHHAHRGS